MKQSDEIKIACIGESGSGKSSMITALAKDVDVLQDAIAKSKGSLGTKVGTTESTVEYVFVVEDIAPKIEKVICAPETIADIKKRNIKFGNYLIKQGLTDTDSDYINKLNNFAYEYILNIKNFNEIYDLINGNGCFFEVISILVTANSELKYKMLKNNIEKLRIFDTRGIGDNDDLKRFIPGGIDMILVMGKMESPAPTIRKGLEDICTEYAEYIPIIFVGKHLFGEDGLNIFSSNSEDEYIKALIEYNNDHSDPIWEYYYNPCKSILDRLYDALKNYISEYRIAHVPLVKNLNAAKPSALKKFYIPACNKLFADCITIIVGYRKVFDNAVKQATFSQLTPVFFSSKVYDRIVSHNFEIVPRNYNWSVDWISVANNISYRDNTALDYSYKAVSVGLCQRVNYVINNYFNGNSIQSGIVRFILKKSLESIKSTWYYGYYGYTYTMLNCVHTIVSNTKKKLEKYTPSLYLNAVICTRRSIEYESNDSIMILLYEETIRYLFENIIENFSSDIGTFIAANTTNNILSSN